MADSPTALTHVRPVPGRLGVLTGASLLVGFIPLPFVPDRVIRQLRGAIVHDVSSRHGISLTTEARRALAARDQPQRDEVSAGATSWMASLRLGESLLLQDRPSDAITAFQACLGALPRRLDGLPAQAATAARVGAAEALLRRDPARALALVEPAMKTPWPDGWAVAAAAAAALHQADEARLFAQQGWERRGAGWLAPHRRTLLDRARR